MKSALSFFFVALTAATLHAELTDEQKLVPLEADTTDASLAKIVLLAGPVSNKAGQHEPDLGVGFQTGNRSKAYQKVSEQSNHLFR